MHEIWALMWNLQLFVVNSSSESRNDKNFSGSSSKVSSACTIPQQPSRSEGEILQSSNLKSFTFIDLRTSTRNFRSDSVLGQGGFGSVYKGWVDEHSFTATKPGSGIIIAVKMLNQVGFQGHKEWLVSALHICVYMYMYVYIKAVYLGKSTVEALC